MGANMARRLKDRGFHVTAVYDTNRAAATELASELGCAAAQDLSEVTAASDVIFTVVTDDNAMRQIFAGAGDNLLVNARGKLFVNCATISPEVHVEIEKLAQQSRCAIARSMHGVEHYPGARRQALPDVRRKRRRVPKSRTDFERACRPDSLRRKSRRSRQGESAGQHGDEHQHRGLGRRSWPRRRARSRPNDACEKFSRRPARTRACSKPTAKTCRTASTAAFSPLRTQPKTAGSRSNSRAISASICRSRALQRNNTTE